MILSHHYPGFLSFGSAENASRVYYKILKNQSTEILTDRERTIFSHFIFTQYTRTKAARQLFKQVHDLIYEDFITTKKYPYKKEFSSYPSYLNNRAYLGQLKIMFDPNKDTDKLMRIPFESSKVIFNLNWKILKNRNKFEFYTSDHPIFIYDPDSDGETIKGYGTHSFQTPKVEMYFPLAPHFCLVLLGKDSSKYNPDKTEVYVDSNDLEWINRQVVAESYQFIFSKSNSFTYVKKVLELYPELKKTNRNRIFV